MQTFSYKAIDKTGREKSGVIQAETAKQARQLLRNQGLIASHIESEKDRKAKSAKNVTFKKKANFNIGALTNHSSICNIAKFRDVD